MTTESTAPAAEAAAPVAPAAPLTAASALTAPAAPPEGEKPATDPATAAPGDKPADGAKLDDGQPAPLVMPGKDATPEQWAEFYSKIGRPESADGYELPVPEGDDGAFAKQMAPILHKHGITADQAKGLAGDWNAMIAAQQQAADKAEQQRIVAMDTKNKAEAVELKNEWGQAHDANMHFAKLAVQQFMPAEKAGDVIAALESTLGYKETIKLLQGIGKGLGEHDAAGMGGNNAQPQKSLAERLYGKP